MKKDLQTNFTARQYMVSKDFEIYYYNDRNMTSVKNHTHDYYEFYFFMGGSVSIEVAGIPQILSPGDVILIPPGTRHHLDILDPEASYQRFIFWISKEYFLHFASLSTDYLYLTECTSLRHSYIYHLDTITFNSIQSLIISMIEEVHGSHFGRETQLSLLIGELLFSLNRYVYEQDHPVNSYETNNLYRSILTHIENHLDEDLTLDSLAAEFFVSKYHISHIFKERLGLSIHQYIIKKRLSVSLPDLLSDAEISTICLRCGFKDYSSYFRAFKKEYGMSPKEYRDTKKKQVK